MSAVRFHAEHQLHGSVQAVTDLLLDPAFHQHLALPDLALPEVIGQDTDGDEATLRLRYEYTGQLDPIARRLLGHRKLTWLQEIRLNRADGSGRLSFAADANPKQLHGDARVRLESDNEDDDSQTLRRIDGQLIVKVPLVGGQAERRIIPGLLRRLDVEAAALNRHLRK
jgi:hypothetical protein